MKRFDFYRYRDSDQYLLNLQTERLGKFDTSVVAPLVPISLLKQPVPRLNPVFDIAGSDYVLITTMIAAVATNELNAFCGSLAYKHHEIMDAIDMLFSGI